MSDNYNKPDGENDLPFYGDHRFLAMIFMSILIAGVLVTISIMLYRSSGAAQLDLSRPGYKQVRSEVVVEDGSLSTFSAVGIIDQTAINDFKTLYDKQAQAAHAIDAFGSDPLNTSTLWPDSTASTTN